jgi:hypothetical protein
VKAILGIDAIFGDDLPRSAAFVDAVAHACAALLTKRSQAATSLTINA